MRKLIYLSSLLLILACKQSSTSKAEALMPKDKFIGVLTDVRLLEGAYTVKYQSIDSSAGMLQDYYAQIFNRHQISKSQFEESYIQYQLEPKLMEEVEDSVLLRLQKMTEQQITNQQ